MGLYLYLVTQGEARGPDTYGGFVVAAPDMETARRRHPQDLSLYGERPPGQTRGTAWEDGSDCWATKPDNVEVELLGTAALGVKPGILLYSFHAG